MSTPPTLPDFYRLLAYDEVGSTNEEARRFAAEGAPEGTLVWARSQSAGRARRGRQWVSDPGNLYFSLILRPNHPAAMAAQLGFAAALAIGEAAVEFLPDNVRVGYKWPNDVLVEGRKLSGILLESQGGAPGRIA
ncbi:MAG TPA: biotin--[acetyl-CoA-carboxylase] ligase, partial [Stellaceae bacterium]|nr:biotin--[acetyl-CoA-carboxylase] ligase [Stellaceae bacterium]